VLAISLFGRVWFGLFLLIGLAIVRWNRRVAQAVAASSTAFYETLGVKWLARLSLFSRPRIARGFVIFCGLWFVAIALLAEVFGK
jgi:tryptophan-rich sensory protein